MLNLAGRRTGAYLIDILILFCVLAPVGFLIQTAIGVRPETGTGIWVAALLNFSAPAWLYFIFSDWSAQGATLGKRILRVRVSDLGSGRISFAQAFLRTAVKLLPWELTHFFAFGLSPQLGEFSVIQWSGIVMADVLIVAYFTLMLATRGQRSVHDFAVGTIVGLHGKPVSPKSARTLA